jgi:hypothetical protein
MDKYNYVNILTYIISHYDVGRYDIFTHFITLGDLLIELNIM